MLEELLTAIRDGRDDLTPSSAPTSTGIPTGEERRRYESANAQPTHLHLLDPCRDDINAMTRSLRARGTKTSMTEILNALVFRAPDAETMEGHIKNLRRARGGL